MIKPYYEHKGITIYHGDCLEILPQLDKVDLVLTDPPYGIGTARKDNVSRGRGRGGLNNSAWGYGKDYGISNWDDNIPNKEVFNQMLNISKNQIIFGGNYFIEYLKNSPCWIVWDKDNGNCDFADCELIWTSFKTAVRIIKWRWSGLLQENMKRKDVRFHPAQKPLGVLKWIIQKYSKENEVILDPFMGSGTTLRAAKDLNLNAIGIEIEEKYCEIAVKRLSQEVFEFNHGYENY